MAQSIERFSNRVDNYARYRPGYPPAIIDVLTAECALEPTSTIADIGSGTGKLSELFLSNGNEVFGVEPNSNMRMAAAQMVKTYPNFHLIDGTAEATTLAEASIDFVAAGQAFHWFEADAFRSECVRILKPDGWAVLVWNERELDTTPFLRDYEQLLLDYGTDYQKVRHENAADAIHNFFRKKEKIRSFPNHQEFDLEGLKGRVLSSSYTPDPKNPLFEPMMQALQEVFRKHQEAGKVSFEYKTRLYYGRL